MDAEKPSGKAVLWSAVISAIAVVVAALIGSNSNSKTDALQAQNQINNNIQIFSGNSPLPQNLSEGRAQENRPSRLPSDQENSNAAPANESAHLASTCIDLKHALVEAPGFERPIRLGTGENPTHISVSAATDTPRDQGAAQKLGDMMQRQGYVVVPADGDLAITVGSVSYLKPQSLESTYIFTASTSAASFVVSAGWRGQGAFLRPSTICGNDNSPDPYGGGSRALDAAMQQFITAVTSASPP